MSQVQNIPNDILQPLPLNQWPLLRDTLRRDWPHYAYYYYWVYNAMKWKEKEPEINLDIYCPGGKYDSGMFIGISSYSICMIIPFAFQESKSQLFDCLVETNQIDWSVGVIFVVHEHFESYVRDAIAHKEKTIGLQLDNNGPSNYYFKPKEECLELKIDIPVGLELRPVQLSDVSLIHELWPREEIKKEPAKSRNFISAMVRLNRSVGLYEKEKGKLVAWALQSEWGGLANVQTVNEYRRRGCAKIVANALSKMLAEEGLDSTLFIATGNTSSENLFAALNYKRINVVTFIVMKPLKR